METNFSQFVKRKYRKSEDHDREYMEMAIRAAEQAKSNGDRPFGAVLVFPGGHMVEHDTTFSERDQTCHAEMNVMRKAARTKLKNLSDCVLYTCGEPCSMCIHAAYLNGIKEVVFGAYDHANGYLSSDKLLAVADEIAVKGGVLSEQCISLLPESHKIHLTGDKNGKK
jgi:tRNA(adenine34) deaminase